MPTKLLITLLLVPLTSCQSLNSFLAQNGQPYAGPLKTVNDDFGILPSNYYKNVAPTQNGQPVIVNVSVSILNMHLSSTASQTLDVDIFYHNLWVDHRLKKPTTDEISQKFNISNPVLTMYKLTHNWHEKLWIPNTYFRNADSGRISNILTPTYYFEVINNNVIFMAVRLSLKLSCRMNFAKFPFDVQKCFINITMTNEDTDTVQLQWDQFKIGKHIDTSEFAIVSTGRSKNCTKDYEDLFMDLSCLFGWIVFKRNIGNYLIKRFIPSFIIVVLTFLGFWIPTTVSPARVSLSVTCLLALITQQVQSDLSVSYTYSLQVWNIICILFVFASLCEFALALFIMHMVQKRKAKVFKRMHSNQSVNGKAPVSLVRMESKVEIPERDLPDHVRYWRRLKAKLAKHFRTTTRHSSIDYVSRYLFPILYFTFVIAFTLHSMNDRQKNAFFL